MQAVAAAPPHMAASASAPLKRCCSESCSSASSSSPSSSAPQSSAASAAATARCKDDKCVDGWRGATECGRSTDFASSAPALTMKDLLNDAGSQDTDCGERDEDIGGDSSELSPRITVEKLEIHELKERRPTNAGDDVKAVDAEKRQTNDGAAASAAPATLSADEALDLKCKRLAKLIAGSTHLVAFTGAGISTSVGLPDYRGDNGIRTKRYDKQQQSNQTKRRKVNSGAAAVRDASSSSASSSDTEAGKQQPAEIPDFNLLVPSKTHMALFELHRLGYLKHLVSQNVDNLHLKSGIPASVLTEVHGNATQAKCETCEKIYTQDFPWTGLCDDPACVSTKRSVAQRLRARTRHGNGRLKRNVISFDEPLGDIDNAIDECEAADVALVLGTSLRVEPFSEMAGEFAESLAIVNLQPTTQKLDKRAESSGVRLFEKCDLVMEKTMKFLLGEQYEIPQWTGEHATSVFIPEHEEKNLVNVLAGRLLS